MVHFPKEGTKGYIFLRGAGYKRVQFSKRGYKRIHFTKEGTKGYILLKGIGCKRVHFSKGYRVKRVQFSKTEGTGYKRVHFSKGYMVQKGTIFQKRVQKGTFY